MKRVKFFSGNYAKARGGVKANRFVGRKCGVSVALEKGKLTAALVTAARQVGAAAKSELLDLISVQEDLKLFDASSLASLAVFTGVSYERLADWLIGRGRAVGAEQAVKDLVRYLEQKEVPVHVVAPLGGVLVEEAIELAAGITLLPLNRVPESQSKAQFLERIRWPGLQVLWRFSSGYSALICPRFRDKGHPEGESWVLLDPPELSEIERQVVDVCRILTIVGPCAPICLGLWEQTEDWVPCGDGLYLDKWFWTWRDAEVPHAWRKLDAEELAQAKDLFGCYLGLADEVRRAIRVPLDRLNDSIRRRNLEDAAIDLGISLEALFGGPGRDRRASEFLRGRPDERDGIKKSVRDIYSLRSRAVHGGRVNGGEAKQVLKSGWEVVAEALRKTILLGKLPE